MLCWTMQMIVGVMLEQHSEETRPENICHCRGMEYFTTQDDPETTDVQMPPGVGFENIFSRDIYEIAFSKNIYENIFNEDDYEPTISRFTDKKIFDGPSTSSPPVEKACITLLFRCHLQRGCQQF